MQTFFTWALALLSVFLATKWQSASRENESLRQRLSPNKESLYKDIISFLMDYFRKDEKPSLEDFKNKVTEFDKSLLLNSSNSVLLAYGDYMQNFYNEDILQKEKTAQSFVLLGNLIIEMRRDLGHGKYFDPIYWFDPFRSWLKDVKKVLPTKMQGFRSSINKRFNYKEAVPIISTELEKQAESQA